MNKRNSKPTAVVATVILGLLSGWLLTACERPTAPAVGFALLDGTRLTLAELRGRPVLVSFWATTCPPCVEELPDLIKLYNELHPKGFELIAVAMSYDPPLQVQRFARQHQIPYPIALDVEDKVLRAFGDLRYIPVAFLVSPDGHLVFRHTGKLDIVKARRIISNLLEK